VKIVPTALAFIIAVLPAQASADAHRPRVTFVLSEQSLWIEVGGHRFARYVFRDEITLRPYFADVYAPGGIQVTRNHPPVEGQDATDHASMHPGIWLAFGDVSGSDFWRNQAMVRHAGFDEAPEDGDGTGRFVVHNRYEAGDETLCDEICRITIEARPTGNWIFWDSEFRAEHEFTFGDQEEMGLGVRVATPLAVQRGGRIANSEGLMGEAQAWGKQADWCDYGGEIHGHRVGLLIMPHPRNFRRSWFHARDYGLLVANPFGQRAFTGSEPSRVVVQPGMSLRLRFAILVYASAIDPAAAWREYRGAVTGAE
jgi:hypothetical protein